MITPAIVSAILLAPVVIAPALAVAQPRAPRDTDWPCQQIKISEMSLPAVWSGPAVDPRDTTWKSDPAVAGLVEKLARRRQPVDRAPALIHDFAQSAGQQKQPRLLLVLVGLFSVLDQERNSIMAGLDRFGRRQKELAAEIRGNNEKLRALQTETPDPSAVRQLTQQVTWEVEVFQDRRQALSYVCDLPAKIDQRLFTLAHQIQQELE